MTRVLAQPPRTDRAFERLYRRNVRHVYGYALAVLRRPEDAEDVTQTTFLNAYRAFERGEHPRHLDGNWLIAIAHKLCDQRARQEARQDELVYDDQVDEAVPDDGDPPTANDVRRSLGRLPFDQRAALIMRELEGRSYAELAAILGVTRGDVEKLLFRARRSLREEHEGALTCHLAERAISRRLDGLLCRAERRQLRRHLGGCDDCSRFARSQRAQRATLRSLGNVPLPESLASFFAEAPQPRGLSGRA
jgi:RNA polymerase sigma factor (sigma-70 family)